jgi:hypothetical protein
MWSCAGTPSQVSTRPSRQSVTSASTHARTHAPALERMQYRREYRRAVGCTLADGMDGSARALAQSAASAHVRRGGNPTRRTAGLRLLGAAIAGGGVYRCNTRMRCAATVRPTPRALPSRAEFCGCGCNAAPCVRTGISGGTTDLGVTAVRALRHRLGASGASPAGPACLHCRTDGYRPPWVGVAQRRGGAIAPGGGACAWCGGGGPSRSKPHTGEPMATRHRGLYIAHGRGELRVGFGGG